MAPLRRHGARPSTISRHVCPRGPTSLLDTDPNSAPALSLNIFCRPFVLLRMCFFENARQPRGKLLERRSLPKVAKQSALKARNQPESGVILKFKTNFFSDVYCICIGFFFLIFRRM